FRLERHLGLAERERGGRVLALEVERIPRAERVARTDDDLAGARATIVAAACAISAVASSASRYPCATALLAAVVTAATYPAWSPYRSCSDRRGSLLSASGRLQPLPFPLAANWKRTFMSGPARCAAVV